MLRARFGTAGLLCDGGTHAMEGFRQDLAAELRKLIKPAIAQAKKGKPALLRILARCTK